MAETRANEVLRHSVIDRLARAGRPGGELRIGLRELKAAVQRDVEWLLNTRCLVEKEMLGLPETMSSNLAYGLPDFTHFSGASAEDCQQVCGLIEHALRTFEPRLAPRSIKVEFVNREASMGLQTHFRIRALLHVDPVREPVVFDTTVEMDTGSIEVRMAE